MNLPARVLRRLSMIALPPLALSLTILGASGCGLFGPESALDGEWHGRASFSHGIDRWALNLVESGGTVTGDYTVITSVADPDPVAYSGAITGSFSPASVFHDPSLGPVYPATLRLDVNIGFRAGGEAWCRYDARLWDGMDVMDGTMLCQIHRLEWATRSGELSLVKS